MKKIEIFDPALCCATGVCGPNVNTELLRISTVLDTLRKQGVEVLRHNLKDEPAAFVANQTVNTYLHEKGVDGLPVTLVDNVIVVMGQYPTNAQLSEWTGVNLNFVPLSK